tara:strand:+ start:461 stop:898 length:438 start_codon:yes stop_codon:yes gene_type:complete
MNSSQQPTCVARELNHIAIAVKNIEETLELYRLLFGLESGQIKEIVDQGVRAALIKVGKTQLEIIQPVQASGSVSRFINKKGEGLHHICFEVENLRATLKRLDEQGIELIDSSPREGLSGMIAFLHPSATRGTLIELIEPDTKNR